MTSTSIVGYLVLFTSVGLLFLFVHLVLGRFLRPAAPNAEKLEVYECGEPAIGTSFVQFDIRFYVVALLFIIFDVEIAFFFPWATVFGKATHLVDPALDTLSRGEYVEVVAGVYRELGVPGALASAVGDTASVQAMAAQIAWVSFADIALFFAVLLVGFAYVWKRGDLDWVRALSQQRATRVRRPPPPATQEQEEPMLVG